MMNEEDLQEPEERASKTFGPAELGDQRRTDRLVTMAAYRFLDTPEVTLAQIMMPHWMSTRQLAAQRPCVLLVADTTEINLSAHQTTEGVGPVGQGLRGRGFYVHTLLALDASTKQMLGCAYQEPFVRQRAPKGETRAQRRKRARESQIWERSAQQIGAAPTEVHWVHVGDRAADIYTFWQTCQQ